MSKKKNLKNKTTSKVYISLHILFVIRVEGVSTLYTFCKYDLLHPLRSV